MTTPAAASATAEPISPAATAHESVKPAPAFEQQRRLQPRLWDTDWLVLRGMRAAIDDVAYRIATPGKVALDFDVIGFIRGRTDDLARVEPEFVEEGTGRTTNTSGGGLGGWWTWRWSSSSGVNWRSSGGSG